ncbi:MAG: TIGR01459 family HAD-type hydrolase [Phenylobacterium sp.]|uniref:TIGR01459 family HAD-type hydrolase n=1 Tax=Phenylobacterium sp. TaxID=1871053 RepID=UPI002732C559|nr:TIGR01459 family HAD-type hydrolase [Phenylobacterium sp.]MDP3174073.1 TIGR01459 family HAD-type hydrolase [Phenylobacterium sp.]
MTQPVAGLSRLADRYDVLLCDIWGVIHDGRVSYPDACAALTRWNAEVGPVVLISNSPRPGADVLPQLDGLKVPRDAFAALVTSGDATRVLLAERAPGPAWAIGPDRDAILYEGLGLEFATPEAAAFIACTGPYDDEVETPEDYRVRLEAAADRGLTMICANPDIVVQRGPKMIYCGGALAQLYEAVGGAVQMAGKPHPPIYDLALAQAALRLSGSLNRERVLCIGDGVPTDVRGANAQGLDVMFVAAGIHGAETLSGEGLNAAGVDALLGEEGVHAAYAMPRLVW